MFYLREVTINDKDDIFEITSDKEVTRFLHWQPHKDINDTIWSIENIYLNAEDNLPNSYAICLNNSNKVIGIIDFHIEDKRLSIGYILNKNYWNKGIMTKALSMMLKIAFNELKVSEVYISHDINNKGSENVILKNGFKLFETKAVEQPIKNRSVVMNYYIKRNEDND